MEREALAGARALVAMSGGVDSSVAALLVRDAGLDATGVTLRLFDNDVVGRGQESGCCSLSDVEDARQVALDLGIEHLVFNFTGVFGREVIERFCEAYAHGRTPNPCIDCNRYVKFAALQRRRADLGFDYVVTGHYARRARDERTGRWLLLRGLDAGKDQSYVLYHLTQGDLAHMLFPVGELTKPEVRALAARHGFGTAGKPESQDICFVPDGDYAAFLARYASRLPDELARDVADSLAPGPICDSAGAVIGRHEGLARFTVGQRKGIGVAASEPLYVLAKEPGRTLVVGPRRELGVREVRARDVNLVGVEAMGEPVRVSAKTHYRHADRSGWAVCAGGELRVVFDEPVARPAAGQSLVVYDGERVLGGGTICGSSREPELELGRSAAAGRGGSTHLL